jgi:uncharacterized protein (DUF736 family)
MEKKKATTTTFKRTDDNRYEGTLVTLTAKTRLTILPNTKTSDDQPHYRVFAGRVGECCLVAGRRARCCRAAARAPGPPPS